MEKFIYVITNSCTDFSGNSLTLDGGAYTDFEKAKKALRDYIVSVWDYMLYDATTTAPSAEDIEDFNNWIDGCFNEDKTLWSYLDNADMDTTIKLTKVELHD